MTGRFARDTAVTPLGDGRFGATLDAGWALPGVEVLNGGYVVAVAARACAAVAEGHPDPATVTTHFLRPLRPGPAEVATRLVHRGGRFTRVAATVTQDGVAALELLTAWTDLATGDGDTAERRGPLPLLPVERCLPLPPDALPSALDERWERRVTPDSLGWTRREPTGTGTIAGWHRLADGEGWDPLAVLALVDSTWPAVFDTGLPVGWVPTVELTVQLRRRPPATGWLGLVTRTRSVVDGLLEEDAEVRDADGRLVALGRQLGIAARPG